MFSALTLGIKQLNDPATRQVLWIGIGSAVLAFLVLFAGVESLLRHTSVFETGWMEAISDILGRIFALVVTWLMFPAAISAVVGLFLERVARCVEARHYPTLPPVEEQPFAEQLLAAGKFLVILVALNFILLLFIFTGPLYAILYYGVNGYLISREFFDLVAIRRLSPAAVQGLRKKHQVTLFMTGVILTFLMTLPIVNLLTPIIATAAMLHLFEGWRMASGAEIITT